MDKVSERSFEITGFLGPDDLEGLIDNAPKCRPGKSQVHGYGLIAFEPIAAGEVIIDFSDPEFYIEKSYSELEPWRLEGWKYTGLSEEKCVISKQLAKYSFLNHSQDPNGVSDFTRRQITALRSIEPGEEITVDLGLEPLPAEIRARYTFL